jgi:hypothetical protein
MQRQRLSSCSAFTPAPPTDVPFRAAKGQGAAHASEMQGLGGLWSALAKAIRRRGQRLGPGTRHARLVGATIGMMLDISDAARPHFGFMKHEGSRRTEHVWPFTPHVL